MALVPRAKVMEVEREMGKEVRKEDAVALVAAVQAVLAEAWVAHSASGAAMRFVHPGQSRMSPCMARHIGPLPDGIRTGALGAELCHP